MIELRLVDQSTNEIEIIFLIKSYPLTDCKLRLVDQSTNEIEIIFLIKSYTVL